MTVNKERIQEGSARDARVARIPLLALRAWMKRASHASPARARGEQDSMEDSFP